MRSTNPCQEAGIVKRSKSIRKPVKAEASPETGSGFVFPSVSSNYSWINFYKTNIVHVFWTILTYQYCMHACHAFTPKAI